MKNLFLLAFTILTFAGAGAGCSSERRTTTTTKESVRTVPADPITTGNSTTIHTETRSQ